MFCFAGASLCGGPGFWNNGFIFKPETYISTHVCLVPVAFSVHGRKCDFRITREVHAKQKTNYTRERGISKKRGQIHQKY